MKMKHVPAAPALVLICSTSVPAQGLGLVLSKNHDDKANIPLRCEFVYPTKVTDGPPTRAVFEVRTGQVIIK